MIALLGIDFRGSPVELAAAGAVLLSALGYAGAALVYRRWLADVPAIGVTALMTAVSSLAFLAPAAVNLPREVPPASSIFALVTLGIINTGLAYWLFYLLIDQAGAATASVITYVMPVVALVLGVALLGAQLTIGAIAGLPLIGLGAWLATSRQPSSTSAGRPPRHGTGADVQDGRSTVLAQQDRLRRGDSAKNRALTRMEPLSPGSGFLADSATHGPRFHMRTTDDTDWRARGACISADPELFFPISSSGVSRRQERRAKAICAVCRVSAECLAFALETRQVHGVWGGLGEEELGRLRRRRRVSHEQSAA